MPLDDLFKKTDKPQTDKIQPRGVGLLRSEWDEIAHIAKTHDVSVNAIAVWALRRFLREYRDGKITLPIKKKNTL